MTADTVLVLRTCNADLTSWGGFQWPETGPVEAPDWNPEPHCGYGLHGWLWGEGDGSFANWEPNARWLVVGVPADSIVEIGGKVKFPRGVVVHCGDRHTATAFLAADPRAAGRAIIGGTATAGDEGTATAGYEGTATAGDEGTATAGYWGTATAGNWGTATAGYEGTATAGYRGTATAGYEGTATAGYRGTATAGDEGTATAGNWGTATAGNWGTATAGNWGTATAGYRGTATAGNWGTATAGDEGTVILFRWDGSRRRAVVGYVGENGIEPGVRYRLNDNGELTAVEPAAVATDG